MAGASGMAVATLASRFLGLAREMLTARVIGGGTLMTAWGLAFMIPNLFRRLFGEGAVGTALVPMLRDAIQRDGREAARNRLTATLAVAGVFLILLSTLIGAAALAILPFVNVERVRLTLTIIPLVIPYLFLICLVGIATSALNCVGKFFFPALTATLLNLALIGALWFVCPIVAGRPKWTLAVLSAAVVLSGAVQLAIILFLLTGEGLFPARLSVTASRSWIAELFRLSIPGLLGASALQISLVIDRSLACWLGDHAVPALIFSDRIVYLPIGVFAISFASAGLSSMSKSISDNDIDGMLSSLSFSVRQLLFICVPVAAFILVFRCELIQLFYLGGRFGVRDLNETALALKYYALGIPAFATLKVMVAAFYSRKDMRTPMLISVTCIIVNTVLNLVLMWSLKQGGIALATVIAAMLNNALLLRALRKRLGGFQTGFAPIALKSVLMAVVAVAVTFAVDRFCVYPFLPPSTWLSTFFRLAIIGSCFVCVYLSCSSVVCPKQLKGLFGK